MGTLKIFKERKFNFNKKDNIEAINANDIDNLGKVQI